MDGSGEEKPGKGSKEGEAVTEAGVCTGCQWVGLRALATRRARTRRGRTRQGFVLVGLGGEQRAGGTWAGGLEEERDGEGLTERGRHVEIGQ